MIYVFVLFTALTNLNYNAILNPPAIISYNTPATFSSTLNISGKATLNNVTTCMSSLNVSGITTLNNMLKFNNIIANKVIPLYDAATPNNFQYVGLGANSGLVLSCFSTADSFKFNVGASTTTANTLMTLMGTGNLGIGTATNINSKLVVYGTLQLQPKILLSGIEYYTGTRDVIEPPNPVRDSEV